MLDIEFKVRHKIGDTYTIDSKPDLWKVAYYPINECGKTGKQYNESRALIEKPIIGGIDFREIPLRYLTATKVVGSKSCIHSFDKIINDPNGNFLIRICIKCDAI